MVFASPIALLVRRCVLKIICIGLVSSSSFGQSRFFTVSHTPYDRQMVRVYPILATNGQWSNQVSPSSRVTQWMSDLRDIPYQYSRHWRTPAEINLVQAADCKGKAVALYAQMRRSGARNLRVVIGKHHIHDSATHAWVEWETSGGSYVLDPTFNETPAKKMELSPMTYVPLYAYDGEHKYRAVNTGFVAPTPRVAVEYASRLYVPASARSTFAHPQRISVGPGQSFSARIRYATSSTQHRQSSLQQPKSNVRRSSSNVEGLHRLGATRARPTAKMQVHAKLMSIHQRTAPNVRSSLPHAVGIRHPRSLDQYRTPVIRMQPTPVSAASQL
jgi:predicted transglutaminase-like cysteine proteinase